MSSDEGDAEGPRVRRFVVTGVLVVAITGVSLFVLQDRVLDVEPAQPVDCGQYPRYEVEGSGASVVISTSADGSLTAATAAIRLRMGRFDVSIRPVPVDRFDGVFEWSTFEVVGRVDQEAFDFVARQLEGHRDAPVTQIELPESARRGLWILRPICPRPEGP